MRRAAVLLLVLIAPSVVDAAAKPSDLAEAARQRAMDRDESRAEARAAADEIARLRNELTALGAAKTEGEKAVGDKGARLAALNAAEADLSARMGENQTKLVRLLSALELYRRDPPPALLVSPRNAKDAVNAAILMQAVTPELERRARVFATEAKHLQALRRQVVLADGALFTAESDVADRRAEIERAIDQKSDLTRRLDAQAATADQAAKQLAARARSLGVIVEGLDPADAGGELRLIPPVPGAPVRRYGEAWPGQSRSEGWAWSPGPGATVVSPGAGRVDYVGRLRGWGVVVILRLPGDRHAVLAGLQSSGVRIGAAVAAGEPIGRMAPAAPLSHDKPLTAPELYLEVRHGDQPVDPARFFGQTTARIGR
jgi:septal ring factor EnvC (AmiA/AmiB activator)